MFNNVACALYYYYSIIMTASFNEYLLAQLFLNSQLMSNSLIV